MGRVRRLVRASLSLLFFALFGLGGFFISPLMYLLKTPRRAQPLVRMLWRPFVAALRLSGIIGVDHRALAKDFRGCVVAANHPTLIDVVLVTALLPKTLYVAKGSLLRNPFVSAFVRHTAMPDDENLPETVRPYLREGWNVLVFPEGTRSPMDGGLNPLHRGTAQLILRTGAPLVCLGIGVSRKILAKGQSPAEIGDRRVVFTIRSDGPSATEACDLSRPLRPAAVRLTEEIRLRICNLLSSAE